MSKKLVLICLAIGVAAAAVIGWRIFSRPGLPEEFAGGNGRLEAETIDVATKYPGRVKEVLTDEGDTVNAGQVVAVIDTEPLEARLRQAEAQIREAEDKHRTAVAQVAVKEAELDFARKQYERSRGLVPTGAVSAEERDLDRAKVDVARAALDGAKAQAIGAESAVAAATAEGQRLKAEINDYTLRSPIRARVQNRMSEPGEVLGPGGKVLSLNDLSDVYMYVFLPADTAGKVAVGAEARVVLDAIPDYPIRAVVSYVSPTAQFTPKTVETAEERHNLSFRVKLQLNKERLREYERLVKVGIPGMGYVRLDDSAEWPPMLQVKPVTDLPWQPTGSAVKN